MANPVTTWGDVFPSPFVKAELLADRPVTLTIASVEMADVESDDKGARERRGVLGFSETDKKIVLNRTRQKCLVAIVPDAHANPQKLIGHRVTFGAGKANLRGQQVDSVAVIGSPELKAPIELTIQHPKRKAIRVILQPT